MNILFNILPIISYCTATTIMYNLSIYNNNKYTGWSRLQSIFCIPFLFIKKYDMKY